MDPKKSEPGVILQYYASDDGLGTEISESSERVMSGNLEGCCATPQGAADPTLTPVPTEETTRPACYGIIRCCTAKR